MSEPGFVVACLSLVLAAVALGWQISSWLYDGRRVRLRLMHGVLGHGGAATGPVDSAGNRRDLTRVRAEGFVGPEVVGVAVTNVGRAPVRIDHYAVELLDGGLSYSPVRAALGPDLPFRLPAGETETWYVPLSDAQRLIESARAAGRQPNPIVRMSVQLGTGDTRRTRRYMQVR